MRDQVLIRANKIKQARDDAVKSKLDRKNRQLEMLDRFAGAFSKRLQRKTEFCAHVRIDPTKREVLISFFHRMYDTVGEMPLCTVRILPARSGRRVRIDVAEATGFPRNGRHYSEADAVRYCCDLAIDMMAASLAAGFVIVGPEQAAAALVEAPASGT